MMIEDGVWIFCVNVTLYVHVFVFPVLGISSKNLFNKPSECLLVILTANTFTLCCQSAERAAC